VIVGLEPPNGRARTAPFIALGGSPGLITSDSTRRRGLVAFQDLRPTLAGSTVGTDGAPIRVVAAVDPLASVGRLDRLVAALVRARVWAILIAAVLGTAALLASLLALLLRRRSATARGGEVLRRAARALLLLGLALPSGYLVASSVAPLSWPLWLGLGIGAAAAIAVGAWLVDRLVSRPPPRPRRVRSERGKKGKDAQAVPEAKEASAVAAAAPPGSTVTAPVGPAAPGAAGPAAPTATPATSAAAPPTPATTAPAAEGQAKDGEVSSWAAPAVLGALLTALIVVDLLLGGVALSRPLLGNSAFDGERFYGLGNGYFAYALAGVFLVLAFRRPSPGAAAALLAALALADGLPILGADVGGALTAMLTAAAAWLLLRRRHWTKLRVLLVAVGALVLAVAIAFGVGLLADQASHSSRIARELLGSDPSAALRSIRHQLSGNFGLLAENFWAWWGPVLVIFAAVASLRPPRLLAGVPAQVRRTVAVGAIGSLLLIVLNDTGVTAAAGSGFVLVAILAWCALEPFPVPPPATATATATGAVPADAVPTPAAVAARPAGEPAPTRSGDTEELWRPSNSPWGARPRRAGLGTEGPRRPPEGSNSEGT
jgi:hypothetical protein